MVKKQMIEIISIDLSNFCSKQCPFCYNHSNKKGNTKWRPEEVISFSKDCVSHGIEAISLGGGEPFEYEGIFQIITALQPIVYLSVTSNGVPLENPNVWRQLQVSKPDKIHLTIHDSANVNEVNRVLDMVRMIASIDIKPGINLLVPSDKLEECHNAYRSMRQHLSSEQIILVPQRFSKTPTPKQLASVAEGEPFQSPSCLLKCSPPSRFVSVSWDKKVHKCSYAGGMQPLETLDYKGLLNALDKISFTTCFSI